MAETVSRRLARSTVAYGHGIGRGEWGAGKSVSSVVEDMASSLCTLCWKRPINSCDTMSSGGVQGRSYPSLNDIHR